MLREGMSEADVLSVVGYRPNSVSSLTCGAKVGHPWPCRMWTYSMMKPRGVELLDIMFRNDGAKWVVNSWHASAT